MAEYVLESERRQRVRVQFKTRVIIKTGNFIKNIVMLSRNISMTGLLAETKRKLPIGESCDIAIIIPGKHSKLVLHVKGKVSRHTSDGIAIRFDNELEWWGIFSIYSNYGK